MTFANELFCNPIRSYPDIFKLICDFKHEIEHEEARKMIKESQIYKKIIKDLKKFKNTTWSCWGNITDYNSKIVYKHQKIGMKYYHCFTFVFKTSKSDKYKCYHFKFCDKYNIKFKDLFFNELLKHHELKPLFMNVVLIGREPRYSLF